MIDNNNKKSNKKKVIGLVIGIVSFVIIIIGATFAYFGSGTIINFNTATITYATDDSHIVTLNGTSAILTLGTINASDMQRFSENIIYYAGKTDKTTTPTEEVIGTASLEEGDINTYSCEFHLRLTHNGENDLISKFLSDSYTNRSAGQLILTINGVEYDFNNGFPSTVVGTMKVSRTITPQIKAGLKFINLKSVDQGYLSDSDGYINIDVDSFECETIGAMQVTYWNLGTRQVDNVTDYHNLSNEGYGVDLIYDDYAVYAYSTQAECESNLSNYTQSQNPRCVKSNSSDYVSFKPANLNFWYQANDSYSSESECNANIPASMSDAFCAQSSSRWYVYGMKAPFLASNQSDCEKKVHRYQPSGWTPTYYPCSHPDNDLYFLIIDNTATFSYWECATGNYLESENPRCEEPMPRVFFRETKYPIEFVNANNNEWSIYSYYYGHFDSLQDCENDVISHSESTDIFKCILIDDYYGIEYNSSNWSDFNTLSACSNYLENNSNNFEHPYCKYDSTSEKYLIYDYMNDDLSENACEAALENVTLPNDVTANCVHKNYTIEYNDSSWTTFNNENDCWDYMYDYYSNFNHPTCKYENNVYKLYDYTTIAYSESECNYYLDTINDSNITARCANDYAIKYEASAYDNIPSKFTSEDDCIDFYEDYYNSDPMYGCEVKYRIGDVLYNETTEICGIVNDNLLCYNPIDHTSVEEFTNTMIDLGGTCDYYSEEYISCNIREKNGSHFELEHSSSYGSSVLYWSPHSSGIYDTLAYQCSYRNGHYGCLWDE